MNNSVKTEGQRQLLEKTEKRGVAAALARYCSVHPALVSKWRQGAKPDTQNRLKIAEFLGISIRSFDLQAERSVSVEAEPGLN